MKKMLLYGLLMHGLNTGFAQLPGAFIQLPTEELQSELFLPLAGGFTTILPTGSNPQTNTHETARSHFFALHHAGFGTFEVPDPQTLTSAARTSKTNASIIPIAVLDVFYENFHPEAFEAGWIVKTDSLLYDMTGPEQSPFVTQEAFSFYIDWNYYYPGTYTLQLNANDLISNHGSNYDNISMDWDDGLGYRTVTLGEAITVSYTDASADREIKLRVERDGVIKESALLLKSTGCANGFELPTLPPWGSTSAAQPWRIETTFNGEAVFGNAFTLTSADNNFDKPFIFVEGIDFGSDVSLYRNGEFGWFEFTCGASENYPFLGLMPSMLQQLLDAGFDLVLLDFGDGADHIEKNSELLIHLINLVNAYKTGTEEIIVAGASMGGQISRIALKKMEDAGTPHCTRTWISLDSPHEGANIPYGLQTTLSFLANFESNAATFVYSYLKRPAARELLLLQLESSGSLRQQYQGYLDELGYPEESRNIGIANGNINGNLLPFGSGTPLLDYGCEFASSEILKLLIIAAAGDPYNSSSNSTYNVISQTSYSQAELCSDFIDCIFGPIASISTWNGTSHIHHEAPQLDNAPGGTRGSIDQFVQSMNQSLSNAGNLFDMVCNTEITSGQYIPSHSFIPTTSALGIKSTYYHMNVSEALASYPTMTPFDRVQGALQGNSVHSEITPEIIELITEEVIHGGNVLGPELTSTSSNGGVFNMARAQNSLLYDVNIDSGGELHINRWLPLHYGEDPLDYPEPGSHLQTRTTTCGAVIDVTTDGLIHIGEGNYGMTALVELRASSTLRLGNGARLIIDEGSVFHARKGSMIQLEGGEIEIRNGGQLILDADAHMTSSGSSVIRLVGTDARFHLHGSIALSDDAVCRFVSEGDAGGRLRVHTTHTAITGSPSAFLIVEGHDEGNVMLDIMPNCVLRSAHGSVAMRFRKGRVNFSPDAGITSGGVFSAGDTYFSGTPDCSGIKLHRGSLLRGCVLEYIPMQAELDLNVLRIEKSVLRDGFVNVYGGGYRFTDVVAERCGVHSEDLELNIQIRDSKFDGGGVTDLVAISDDSSVSLFCTNTLVEGYQTGIAKYTGELRMKCSTVEQCNYAVYAGLYSIVNLSSWYGGGYNRFFDNTVHIRVVGAQALWLNAGFNAFSAAHLYVFSGTLLGSCDENCERELNFTGNVWQNNNGGPVPDQVKLMMLDPMCTTANTSLPNSGCIVTVIDKAPVLEIECPAAIVRPIQNSGLAKSTSGFDSYLNLFTEGLASSPLYASAPNPELSASRFWTLIELEANADSVELIELQHAAAFHLQNLVEEQWLAADGAVAVFDAYTQHLSEALNLLATGIFANDHRVERTAFELMKSQLLYALDRDDDAAAVLLEAAQCGFDELGQQSAEAAHARIDRRRARTHHTATYYDLDSAFVFTPLPIGYMALDPINSTSFGAHLGSDGTVSYPVCVAVSYNQTEQTDGLIALGSSFQIMPNPATEPLVLQWYGEEEQRAVCRVMNSLGQILHEETREFAPHSRVTLQYVGLAPGIYFVTLSGGWGSATQRVLVN